MVLRFTTILPNCFETCNCSFCSLCATVSGNWKTAEGGERYKAGAGDTPVPARPTPTEYGPAGPGPGVQSPRDRLPDTARGRSGLWAFQRTQAGPAGDRDGHTCRRPYGMPRWGQRLKLCSCAMRRYQNEAWWCWAGCRPPLRCGETGDFC